MLRTLPTKILPAEPQIAIVRAFFTKHGTALCTAAGLIDGAAGTARVLRLMSTLREAPRLDHPIRRRLVDLHRLLSLDPFVKAFKPDLSTWTLLDPASDEVKELCLLTDRLYDLLIDISYLNTKRDGQALDLPAQMAG